MSSKTIHIEGLDLAGKSTICRLLAVGQNAEKRNNSILPTGENTVHQVAERFRKSKGLNDIEIGGLYYGSLLIDLRNYKPSEELVIQDSTLLLRSIAYHSVFGDKALSEKFKELIPVQPRFGFSCLLKASDEVRISRLQGRISRGNDNPEDFLIQKAPQKFHEMEDILENLITEYFGGIVIDSSSLEKEGEKERIVNLILEKANV